ncbi:hypothetical protein PVK06_009069 [Gossypium arboreum]|uniref:Uncharacterized protein n=1 Tax=Gossypium arboreum TaxID=29729 RepID=A0ABR0QMH0_GOSAR|nr:hypothetical protein PVK06_009069 [Gossypium arboreum]
MISDSRVLKIVWRLNVPPKVPRLFLWLVPPSSMKLSLDGAWKFGAKKAGVGGVLRDYGLVGGLFHGSILTSSPVESKQ